MPREAERELCRFHVRYTVQNCWNPSSVGDSDDESETECHQEMAGKEGQRKMAQMANVSNRDGPEMTKTIQ